MSNDNLKLTSVVIAIITFIFIIIATISLFWGDNVSANWVNMIALLGALVSFYAGFATVVVGMFTENKD